MRQVRIEGTPVDFRLFVYDSHSGQVMFSNSFDGELTSVEVRCHESKGLDALIWHLSGLSISSQHRDIVYGEALPGLTEEIPPQNLPINVPCGVFVEVNAVDGAKKRGGIIFVMGLNHGTKRVEGLFESIDEVYEYFIWQIS